MISFIIITNQIFEFQILALFGTSIIAPLPPCSPFLFVNKMIESNNWSSDMNPFYPVKPCPYKDPSKAPHHMRFVTDNGKKFLIDHIQQELAWIRKIGKYQVSSHQIKTFYNIEKI